MTERSALHDTFVIERAYPVPASRVFGAFATKEAKDAWGDTGDLSEPGADAHHTGRLFVRNTSLSVFYLCLC
jgi:uncharacterized protein YndB with AHSA1/START domain